MMGIDDGDVVDETAGWTLILLLLVGRVEEG